MDQFKKGGKLQNSNLFATNRLYAKNPLFKKRKKKAPGIYNPNAKYKFPDGGLVEVRGYEGNRFRKNANGKWEYESGAPVTDPLLIQKLTYEAVPVGSPVVQGAPKVTIKPQVTSQQRIQKINDLSKSPRLADQEQATILAEEQRNVDIYNPEVTPEEKIKPVKPNEIQGLRNLEWDINASLGYPFERAHTAAAAAAEDPGEEIDNFRHPLAGRYVAEGIRDYVADVPYESIPLVGGYVNNFMDQYVAPSLGFVGSNILGAGHEFMTLNNPGEDDRSLLTRLSEASEDLYNNYVGAKVGASNMTPIDKTNYLLYLSNNNKLPDGVVIEKDPKAKGPNNLYFKKGPNDPGKYNSSYKKGGVIELDIPESEIAFYVNGGYVVEDISVPSLNRMDNGGTLYTYAGNPNASYKKIGDQWYISHKGTGNRFVPIQDPDGKRAAELNKNAVVLPGQPPQVEQPRGVQGNVGPAKLPGQAKMELSSATRTAPTVQNQQKIKTLQNEVEVEKKREAELKKKEQAEQEKLEQAQRNPSESTSFVPPVQMPTPSSFNYSFDPEKDKQARDKEIDRLITSGDAGILLGDEYLQQAGTNNGISMRDMLEQKLYSNPTEFYKDLEKAKYQNFLKREQNAYDNLAWYDKGINELGNFIADPVHTGATWMGGNRTLVDQASGVRDESNPNYKYYNQATGYEDDYANKIFNWVNPGSNGADMAVHARQGDALGASLDLASALFKGKVASQGLKATSSELTDILKKPILGSGITGNDALKVYSAYEAGTKYAPDAYQSFSDFAKTGDYGDLGKGVYDVLKVGTATLPYTKYNDANLYPKINNARTVFGFGDSSVKGTGAGQADDQLKALEKVNKVAAQVENLKKPIALATFLRFAKPQKTGGSVETELTEQEIQDLIAQGYVIEQV